MGIVDFAASAGDPLKVIRWCQHSPSINSLRVIVGEDLFTLIPIAEGGWQWLACGLTEVCAIDLRGLTPAEALGQRLTVWYEEEHAGKVVDVPYTGVVLAVNSRHGLSVQFDTLTAEGKPELLMISNEDDWMWGVHHIKAGGRVQVPPS